MVKSESTELNEMRKTVTSPDKFLKAPQDRKRFTTSYIIFSMAKHLEIGDRIRREGISNAVPVLAKMVAKEWRELSDEERAILNKRVEDDKKRFEMEKMTSTAPWRIPVTRGTRKDPDIPKRPMSAFQTFAKVSRTAVLKENPLLSNTDLSKRLCEKWKDASDTIRNQFIEREAEQHREYKSLIEEWRSRNGEISIDQHMERVDIIRRAVNNGRNATHPKYNNDVTMTQAYPPFPAKDHPLHEYSNVPDYYDSSEMSNITKQLSHTNETLRGLPFTSSDTANESRNIREDLSNSMTRQEASNSYFQHRYLTHPREIGNSPITDRSLYNPSHATVNASSSSCHYPSDPYTPDAFYHQDNRVSVNTHRAQATTDHDIEGGHIASSGYGY